MRWRRLKHAIQMRWIEDYDEELEEDDNPTIPLLRVRDTPDETQSATEAMIIWWMDKVMEGLELGAARAGS